MTIHKNPGPPLRSVFRGVIDSIPLRWRTKLGITRVVQKQPVDVDVSILTGTLVASSVEQELTDERKKTDVSINDPTGQTMVEYVRTKDGQVGTRHIKYVPEGTAPPTFDELSIEFTQEASGNGWVEQIFTTVPNLFGGYDYSIERRDVVPPEFAALLQTTEVSHTEAGTASQPSLAVGELMRREQQVDEATKRITVRSRDLATLPKTLVDKDTDEHKQIVTVTKTWQLDATSPPAPTSTTNVKLNRLGDGTSIQTVLGVPNLFGSNDYTVERRDAVPADFAALIQVVELDTTVAGTAGFPTLLDGELFRSETQTDEFNKRVKVRGRSLVNLPQTITGKKTNQDKQVVSVTRIWDVDTATPAVPTATQDVEFTKLGDGTAIEERLGISNVFGGNDYTRERPDRTPPDFGALLEIEEFSDTVSGTASDPTLGVGELFREEKQLTEFTKRVTVRSRDVASLPITLVNSRTNQDKQVVTVTRKWELDSATVLLPLATRDVTFELLGDGTAIETREVISAVFGREEFMIERTDRVPADFGALLEVTETSTDSAGTASMPTLFAGELMRSEKQLTDLTRRITIRGRDISALPLTLTGKKTNQDKQVVSVTRIWELDTTVPAVPTAIQDVEFTKLGDGTAVEERLGIPNVFDGNDFTRERPDRVPPEFGALLEVTETSVDSAGIASDPTLLAGELLREERQLTELTKRVKVRVRDLASLPKTLVSYDTDENLQVVTVTRIWEVDTTVPAVPTALKKVTFELLGDGTAIETRREVVEVFPNDSYTKSILNLIPEKLRARIPMSESVVDSSGSPSTNPTLLTGELSRTEGRLTEFTKRVRIISLGSISPPINVTDYGLTEEFGGNTTTITSTLDTHALMTIDTGLMVIKSELTDLHNGYDIKVTEEGDGGSWPTISSQSFDKEMQVTAFIEEQVVDPSYTVTTGPYLIETLKGIDEWRSKRTKITKTPDAVDVASALVEEVDGPFQFPGLVYAVTGGYYVRRASAQLCQHTIRTWWVSNPTKPTIATNEIIMDDIIISELNDVTRLAYSGMALHDAITTFGVFVYAATTPDSSTYISSWIGVEKISAASVEETDIPELWKIQTKSVVMR